MLGLEMPCLVGYFFFCSSNHCVFQLVWLPPLGAFCRTLGRQGAPCPSSRHGRSQRWHHPSPCHGCPLRCSSSASARPNRWSSDDASRRRTCARQGDSGRGPPTRISKDDASLCGPPTRTFKDDASASGCPTRNQEPGGDVTRTSVMPVSSLLCSMGSVAVTERSLVGFVTVTRMGTRPLPAEGVWGRSECGVEVWCHAFEA